MPLCLNPAKALCLHNLLCKTDCLGRSKCYTRDGSHHFGAWYQRGCSFNRSLLPSVGALIWVMWNNLYGHYGWRTCGSKNIKQFQTFTIQIIVSLPKCPWFPDFPIPPKVFILKNILCPPEVSNILVFLENGSPKKCPCEDKCACVH